jgi:hypothetical protein
LLSQEPGAESSASVLGTAANKKTNNQSEEDYFWRN